MAQDETSANETLEDSGCVAVPRAVLREILDDGVCPLHLRMQLQWAMEQVSVRNPVLYSKKDLQDPTKVSMVQITTPCLARIAEHLNLQEVLAVRCTSSSGLEWSMQRCVELKGDLRWVHDRIRTRLWVERIWGVTKDTTDETVFETKVRSFANDVLRRRMEAEMVETKMHMERQIHAFQGEVDRRMEEQAQRVHAIVEERVHQQVNAIMASEMERVRVMVEERVQERVRQIVQREVCNTVCEVQARLAALALENDRLRSTFAEHSDICFRSLVWALSPNASGVLPKALRLLWCCRRRCGKISAWLFGIPPERKRERLRLRLESVGRRGSLAASEESASSLLSLASIDGEDGRLNSGSLLQNLLTPALTAPGTGTEALFAGTPLADQDNMLMSDAAAPQDGNLPSPENLGDASDAGAPAAEEQSEEPEDPVEESGLAEEGPEAPEAAESESEGPPRLELPSEEEIDYVEDSEESDPLDDAVTAAIAAEVDDSPSHSPARTNVKEIEVDKFAEDIAGDDVACNDTDLYQDVEDDEEEYLEAHDEFVDAEQHTNSM